MGWWGGFEGKKSKTERGGPKAHLYLLLGLGYKYNGPDEIKPEKQIGTIVVSDVYLSQHLYQVESVEMNRPAIQPRDELILTSPQEDSISSRGRLNIEVDLFCGDYKSSICYKWFPSNKGLDNCPLEKRILSKDGTGEILVLYALFNNAMEAHLEIEFHKVFLRCILCTNNTLTIILAASGDILLQSSSLHTSSFSYSVKYVSLSEYIPIALYNPSESLSVSTDAAKAISASDMNAQELYLAEVFNVIYLGPDEIKPEKQIGTIVISDDYSSQYLYQVESVDMNRPAIQPRDELILTGPHEESISRSCPLEKRILSKDGTGEILVLCALFNNAMEAHLEIELLTNDESAINGHGVVAASTSAILQPGFSSTVFMKKPSSGMNVGHKEQIPLSRSVIAVPYESTLFLDFHLLDDDENDIVEGFVEFLAKPGSESKQRFKGLIWATAEDLARNRGRVLSLYLQLLRSLNSPNLPLNLAARLHKKAEVRAIFMLTSEERSLHNVDELIKL
ncbi:hypothetical protein POM88_000032 [Heracleum sosnowskyi]|uniref:Uncharacterized protein n=1 Tax=Heracleum sosnowskyi TaxID=360622 RepID=A0AAD8N8Y7_9APIA|nr:hypothetical protein POM88_000032 [Heracleum sosnowskyi]